MTLWNVAHASGYIPSFVERLIGGLAVINMYICVHIFVCAQGFMWLSAHENMCARMHMQT